MLQWNSRATPWSWGQRKFSQNDFMPHPWKHSRPGWTALWATWSSGRCLCLLQGGWTRWPLKVASNPNYSMILFYNSMIVHILRYALHGINIKHLLLPQVFTWLVSSLTWLKNKRIAILRSPIWENTQTVAALLLPSQFSWSKGV